MSVKARKALVAIEADGPCVVLSLGTGETVEILTASKKLVTYTVLVEIVMPGGAKLADVSPVLSWRQQISRALEARTAWEGFVSGWNRTNSQPLTPFDKAALDKGLSVSLQRFTVEVIEPRG